MRKKWIPLFNGKGEDIIEIISLTKNIPAGIMTIEGNDIAEIDQQLFKFDLYFIPKEFNTSDLTDLFQIYGDGDNVFITLHNFDESIPEEVVEKYPNIFKQGNSSIVALSKELNKNKELAPKNWIEFFEEKYM